MQTPAARRWFPIVQRARRSGLPIRAFARQNGINANTLAWWSWRFGVDGHDGSEFVDVEVDVEVESTVPPLWLHLGAVRIGIEAGTDLALLRRVIEALS